MPQVHKCSNSSSKTKAVGTTFPVHAHFKILKAIHAITMCSTAQAKPADNSNAIQPIKLNDVIPELED